MGYSFVNCQQLKSTSGNNVSGTLSATAGNALFAPEAAYMGGDTTHTPTISGGGTWTQDVSVNNFTDGTQTFNMACAISSCPSATGGSQTFTGASNASGGKGVQLSIYEFSGNPSSSIKDANSPAAAYSNANVTSETTNSLSNVTANALFIALCQDADGSAAGTMTGTTTGWTYPALGKFTNGSTGGQEYGSGYNIVSSVAGQTSNWTISSSYAQAIIAVYKAAGGIPTRWLVGPSPGGPGNTWLVGPSVAP
jgi:hypothetical protein